MEYIFTAIVIMVEFAPAAGACVFISAQGLLLPQGLDLDCYEQMVIITKAQKAAEDRGVLL